VAGLVAQGMSNPQIAAQLFLSRRTVQTHVSHILAKLNLSSRIDIAREAARRG
jgi:DNA-binding NarL/FixJ family response regulator